MLVFDLAGFIQLFAWQKPLDFFIFFIGRIVVVGQIDIKTIFLVRKMAYYIYGGVNFQVWPNRYTN